MKYFFILFVVFSLFSIQGFTQEKQDTDSAREQIEKWEASLSENFKKGDAIAMAEGYSMDAIVFPPNAPEIKGREAITKLWQGMLSMGKIDIKFNTDKVDVFGSAASSYGTYQLEITMVDGTVIRDNGKFLEVWEKQEDGDWLRTYDMWNSSVPQPTVTQKN